MGSRGRLASDRWGSIALTMWTLAAAGTVGAAEPGYELTVGVGETDNLTRGPDGPSATILMEGLDLSWHDQRPRVSTDVDADLQYLTYIPRTYHSEVVGNFLGNLRATLAPQLLFWDFSDNFGQGRIDPLTAVSPLNRENINYFNTGPELLVPLSATNLLDIDTHYGNVSYQTSDLNSSRYSARLGLIHQLSPQATVSLNGTDERVNFKDDLGNPDYSRQDAFVRFDGHSNRTTIGVDLGYSKLRDPLASGGEVLARLQVSRKLSASSTVALSVGHQYSDAADAFLLGQTIGGANLATQTTTQTGAPFKSTYETLAWNFQRNRTGFGLSVAQYKEVYQDLATANDTRTQANAHISRLLSPTLTVGIGEDYFHQVFQSVDATATENDTDAQLTWHVSRSVSLMLDVLHANRHSNVAGTDFTENLVWLTVGYGRPAQVPPGPVTPPLPNQKPY